ncbi:hypothetical protein [Peribacillus sp. NPDC097895]|uniref:hypothetical protein n=1 Tax=Peribacillus sp. NPDC097895 TaxID=3390619 RepID=UPI003D07CB00
MQNRQGDLDNEIFLETFLFATKDVLGMEEVTFYKFDEWKQQFYKEASTGNLHDSIMQAPAQEYIEMIWREHEDDGEELVHIQQDVQDFQVVIPLWGNGKVIGVTAFTERKDS